MIQFTSLSGKMAGTEWVARRFPVRIGRAPDCHVRLDDHGVWDVHAEVTLNREKAFVFAVLGDDSRRSAASLSSRLSCTTGM